MISEPNTPRHTLPLALLKVSSEKPFVNASGTSMLLEVTLFIPRTSGVTHPCECAAMVITFLSISIASVGGVNFICSADAVRGTHEIISANKRITLNERKYFILIFLLRYILFFKRVSRTFIYTNQNLNMYFAFPTYFFMFLKKP